jgi:DNA-binding MarR family transcriptional regulator
VSRSETQRKQLVQGIVEQARRGSTRSVLLHTAIAERLGLNPSDHKCADLLMSESGLSTPGRLAELTGLSTGAITGVLDRLERAGFVAREPDASDRRRTLVRITPERMPNMKRIFSPLMQGMERLCANYTTTELSLILRFMRESEQMAIAAAEEVRKQTEASAKRPGGSTV